MRRPLHQAHAATRPRRHPRLGPRPHVQLTPRRPGWRHGGLRDRRAVPSSGDRHLLRLLLPRWLVPHAQAPHRRPARRVRGSRRERPVGRDRGRTLHQGGVLVRGGRRRQHGLRLLHRRRRRAARHAARGRVHRDHLGCLALARPLPRPPLHWHVPRARRDGGGWPRRLQARRLRVPGEPGARHGRLQEKGGACDHRELSKG
mmetsp:Transcript_13233/g.25716  ORF Transcript_13233/g.25716 Transcript_13233/m.25716 type:complete len:202 (-) Transcript_13233:266-871(-)